MNMKMSKWLWALLFGIGAMKFSIGDDEGGGNADNKGGDDDQGGGGENDDQGGQGNSDDDAGKGDEIDDGKGGKRKPTDAEAKLLKETMERKKQLKQAHEDKQKLETRLKDFDGIDPAEVKKLLQEKKDRENQELEAKGQWDSLKKQMAEEHAKEKTALSEKASAAEAKLTTLEEKIADLTIGQAFVQSAFIKDELALTPGKTRVVYGAHFDFDDEGKVVGYDKPKGASGRVALVDGQGESLGFDAALRKLIDSDPDRDQLLRSKVKPGAGSKTNGGKRETGNEALTGRNRIAEALKKGGIS